MHNKNIIKIVMSLLLTVGVSSSLMATAFIDKQQLGLEEAKVKWQQKNIPSGMQLGDLRAPTVRDSGAENVAIYIENVNFDVVDNIGFYIEKLSASLEPKVAGQPVVFDDVGSFTINVHNGTVVLSPQVITDLFNKHILDYWPRPLDELTVTTKDGYLEVDADLKLWSWFPGIWLPANLGGNIVLNADNKLVYEIDDVRVLGIPLYGLLSTIFVDLDLLLSIDREGAQLVGSVLELDHTAVFPPPSLAGRIASASLDSNGLRLVFADNEAAKFNKPQVDSNSYLWMQSGDPRLFGIVVVNAGVQVVAEDTSKPLRFNLYDYRKQVAAGTLKMARNGNIIATIPSSDGPDYQAATSTSSISTLVLKTPVLVDDECINKAGFNVCAEETENAVTPILDKTVEVMPMSTETKMALKNKEAGTCFNRAGFEVACQ